TPLWRNGPPEKPVLCNACGSRYRIRGTLENYAPMHTKLPVITHRDPKILKIEEGFEEGQVERHAWNPPIPSQKKQRSFQNHQSLTPIQMLQREFGNILKYQCVSFFKETAEDVLIFKKNNLQVQGNEIGVGIVRLKPSTTSKGKKACEAKSSLQDREAAGPKGPSIQPLRSDLWFASLTLTVTLPPPPTSPTTTTTSPQIRRYQLFFSLVVASPSSSMDIRFLSRSRPNPPQKLVILCFTLLSFLIAIKSAHASIHIYNNQPFTEVGNSFLLSGGSEGLLSASSSRNAASTSFIRFEKITFWRTKEAAEEHSEMEQSSGLVQVVIFEAADRNNIGGSAYGGQRSICCTPDLAKMQGCKQGEVIRKASATDAAWPVVLNVQFGGNYQEAVMEDTVVNVTKEGMYNLFFFACDPKLKGLVMSGKTVWKNPDGYLPGRMAPLMKFYVIMSLAYMILAMVWFAQYARFWKDVLQLQHCVAVVIGLGLFEMLLWYADYANFNRTGMRPVAITTWVVTVGAVRKTVSRLLVLCVAMGYGVVRPTLGGLTSKVILLGVTYFLASELLNVTEYVGTISDFSGRARLLLVLPDAFLDAFLILWIFTSLSRTLEQLQVKRSAVKLDIYRKFSNALAAIVIASVAWIGYEVYFKATDPFNEKWKSAWLITAFWDILAFVLLCVVCYLWAPSQSSQRYAYSEEVGEEFNDEEGQSLMRGKPEGDINLVEKKDRNVGNTDGFDQEDEPEEDKRE
ncbi:hypothetical protein Tsubulata_028454, partial [Turnera subulata]